MTSRHLAISAVAVPIFAPVLAMMGKATQGDALGLSSGVFFAVWFVLPPLVSLAVLRGSFLTFASLVLIVAGVVFGVLWGVGEVGEGRSASSDWEQALVLLFRAWLPVALFSIFGMWLAQVLRGSHRAGDSAADPHPNA